MLLMIYYQTALHKAYKSGSTECIIELLAHGVDTTIEARDGWNPLDKDAVIALLLKEDKKHTDLKKKHTDLKKKHTDLKKRTDLTTVVSKPNTLDAKLTQYVASTLGTDRLSSSMVETIIDQRCGDLKREMVDCHHKEMMKMTSVIEGKMETIMKNQSTVFHDDRVSQSLSNLGKSQSSSSLGTEVGDMKKEIDHRGEKLMTDIITTLEDKIDQSFETLTTQMTTSNAEVAKCISNLSTMVGHLSSKVDANEDLVKQLFDERKQRTIMEGEGDVVPDGGSTCASAVDDEGSN